jgi:hypothetical protein
MLLCFCAVPCCAVQSSLGHEAATEWSLLAEPLEPHLASAGVLAGMGPRIAVVAALHQLALAAGLLTPPEQPQCNGHSSHAVADDGFKAAAVSAGAELCRVWMQVRRGFVQMQAGSGAYSVRPGCQLSRVWLGRGVELYAHGCCVMQQLPLPALLMTGRGGVR